MPHHQQQEDIVSIPSSEKADTQCKQFPFLSYIIVVRVIKLKHFNDLSLGLGFMTIFPENSDYFHGIPELKLFNFVRNGIHKVE